MVGYVVLHRHGHRAPEKNLFKLNDNETQLWLSLLPRQETLQELSATYPIRIHENNPRPQFDVATKPFGCITSKGVDHLKSVGKRLKDTFPDLHNIRNAKVYATNYQRTQVSD